MIASGLRLSGMNKPRKSQDEKELENLAKKLLSMPHKPREESKTGKRGVEKRRKRKLGLAHDLLGDPLGHRQIGLRNERLAAPPRPR